MASGIYPWGNFSADNIGSFAFSVPFSIFRVKSIFPQRALLWAKLSKPYGQQATENRCQSPGQRDSRFCVKYVTGIFFSKSFPNFDFWE
jgi:hypothetical protein